MIFGRRTFMGGALAVPLAAKAWAADPPAAIRRLSPGLDRGIAPDAAIQTIATGIQWAEGPVWLPDRKARLFSDPREEVRRVEIESVCTVEYRRRPYSKKKTE